MNFSVRLLFGILSSLLVASCSTNTMPDAADMDRYQKKAEEMAEARIDTLREKLRNGEITQDQFDAQSESVRARIQTHAQDLAWARHENIEAQKRAMGVPTGGNPVEVQVPGSGGPNSFYRRAGQYGGNMQGSTPAGSPITGGPNRGETPTLPPLKPPGGQPAPQQPEPEPTEDPTAPLAPPTD